MQCYVAFPGVHHTGLELEGSRLEVLSSQFELAVIALAGVLLSGFVSGRSTLTLWLPFMIQICIQLSPVPR